MTITHQAFSLVEKAGLVQVRYLTLRLRDQDGCKVYLGSYMAIMASNGTRFMVTWTYFQKAPLGGRPNTKPGDHGTPNAHNHWFILFHQVWWPAWIEIHWDEGMVTYDFTIHLRICDHATWFWRCVGTAFEHFPLGSHNFMVTAFGSCVKLP